VSQCSPAAIERRESQAGRPEKGEQSGRKGAGEVGAGGERGRKGNGNVRIVITRTDTHVIITMMHLYVLHMCMGRKVEGREMDKVCIASTIIYMLQ
jgi:hypothetical protein